VDLALQGLDWGIPALKLLDDNSISSSLIWSALLYEITVMGLRRQQVSRKDIAEVTK